MAVVRVACVPGLIWHEIWYVWNQGVDGQSLLGYDFLRPPRVLAVLKVAP